MRAGRLPGIWFEYYSLIFWERAWLWSLIVFLHFALSAILSRSPLVQRLFTSYDDLHHQVWARAEVEFHRQGLGDTRFQTGGLVFISLMDRQALVLAGKGLPDKLPCNAWEPAIRMITQGARSGRLAEKLEAALRECGAYLALHFPAEEGRAHERPNTVILKD